MSKPSNYDIFDVTFDILINSLVMDNKVNDNDIDNKLSNIVWQELKLKSVSHYDTIKQNRLKIFETFDNLISLKKIIYNQIMNGTKLNVELCDRLKIVIEKRLSMQQLSADNRLKELVFEIIGEYGKSNIRGI